MASVLAGSGEIPVASITCPRITILVQKILHFSLLRVTPAASSFSIRHVNNYHVLSCLCQSQGCRQHGIPRLVTIVVSHSFITGNIRARL